MVIRNLVIDAIQKKTGCDPSDIIHLECPDEILECQDDISTWYSAIRSGCDIKAWIILVQLEDLDPTRIEVVCESDGPYVFWPSQELLDKLTPARDERSILWRRACRQIMSGDEILGSPYRTFSDDPPHQEGSITSLLAYTEREAYRRGIEDFHNGISRSDTGVYQPGHINHSAWLDGWLWSKAEFSALADAQREMEEEEPQKS